MPSHYKVDKRPTYGLSLSILRLCMTDAELEKLIDKYMEAKANKYEKSKTI